MKIIICYLVVFVLLLVPLENGATEKPETFQEDIFNKGGAQRSPQLKPIIASYDEETSILALVFNRLVENANISIYKDGNIVYSQDYKIVTKGVTLNYTLSDFGEGNYSACIKVNETSLVEINDIYINSNAGSY